MSDYETTQRKRNMIVGVFVIIGICALVWLIFKFGDLPSAFTKMGSFEVFVQFPTATGVQTDTPVRFCGYQIGRVTKVMPPEIRRDMVSGLEYYQTVVVLSIDKKYVNIPSNIEVKLMTRGLGSSYIELKQYPDMPEVPIDPNRPETIFLVDKIWLQGSTGMTSEFFPEESQKKLDEVAEGLRTFISNANDIIGHPSNKENLQKMLANLADASQQATETMQQARQTIEEFRIFAVAGTTTLTNADAKAEELVVAMVDTSEEIGKAAAGLRQILEKVNNGQGSAARLINDGRFYERLLENTQQLQLLLEEIKSFVTTARDKGVPLKLK
ncbi:MAG TPA: MlaD family protein [Sedimentisphaerales bacterium]|nr:MlaD family protein [Sedimentisphaerales bacterium]